MSLIKCDNVTLAYDGAAIVTDLSFEVNNGDYLCIIGENGSGKSTLLKTILGLNKCSSGSIAFGDGLKQTQIGYLPQQTAAQKDFPASVYEIVISGCLNRRGLKPFYSKRDKQLAGKNIDLLGITPLKNCCYRELSGGQQQRVLLARALCATGSIILLDEPMTGLDPIVSAELYSIIKQLNDSGITVVMVSHDISNALKYASHILYMGQSKHYFADTETYLRSNYGRRFFGGETQ